MKKKKKIPKSENRLHPPAYCFASTFNNNSLLSFPFLFHTHCWPRARTGARWLLSSAGDPEISLCPVFTHERTIINKKKKIELLGGIVLSAPPRHPEGLSPASLGVLDETFDVTRFQTGPIPLARILCIRVSISRFYFLNFPYSLYFVRRGGTSRHTNYIRLTINTFIDIADIIRQITGSSSLPVRYNLRRALLRADEMLF